MTDIKREQIGVERLKFGMFVAELDRPWEGTPFLLQGFVLSNDEQIGALRRLCSFVYIDRTRSTGEHFAAPKKEDVSVKREGSVVRLKDPSKIETPKVPATNTQNKSTNKNGFLEVLRDIKNFQAPKNNERASQDGTLFNMKYGADSAIQTTLPYEKSENYSQQTVAKDLTSGIGGFFSGLFKRDKLKSHVDGVPLGKNPTTQNADDHYVVRIYEEEPPVENEIAAIYPVYEQSQIATREIFDSVANAHDLDLTAVSEVLDNMVESIGRSPDALLWLAKLKQTDDYAYNHALNVSITLMAFSNFLALSKAQVKEMGLAGLLQDVGKIKLSADVLLKEGKLTKEEYEYAKKHVDETLKILESTPDITPAVIQTVAQHHERIDGSGYPSKLTENHIALSAQIAGLIDTYCAITSHKSYAKAVFHQQALDIIHDLSGKLFSNALVDQLVQFMGMYPVSSLVELNTGEVGVVIQQNQVRRLLPRLMLLLDPKKERYTSPVILNLLNSPQSPNGEPYKIVKSLAPDSYGLNPSDFFA